MLQCFAMACRVQANTRSNVSDFLDQNQYRHADFRGQARLAELSKKLATLATAGSTLPTVKANYKKALQKSKDDVAKLKAYQAKLKSSLKKNSKSLTAQKNATAKTQQDLKKANQKVAATNDTLEETLAQLALADAQVTSSKNENKRLKAEVNKLEVQVEKQKTRIDFELKEQRKFVGQHNDAISALQSKLAQAQAEVERAESDAAALRAKVEEMSAKNIQAQKEQEKLVDKLRKSYVQMQEQLKEIAEAREKATETMREERKNAFIRVKNAKELQKQLFAERNKLLRDNETLKKNNEYLNSTQTDEQIKQIAEENKKLGIELAENEAKYQAWQAKWMEEHVKVEKDLEYANENYALLKGRYVKLQNKLPDPSVVNRAEIVTAEYHATQAALEGELQREHEELVHATEQIELKNETIAELQTRIDTFSEANVKSIIAEYDATLDEQQREIEALREELAKYDATRDEQQREIEALREELDVETYTNFDDETRACDRLKNELAAITQKLAAKNSDHKEALAKQAAQFRIDLAAYEEKHTMMQQEYFKRETRLHSLQQQLEASLRVQERLTAEKKVLKQAGLPGNLVVGNLRAEIDLLQSELDQEQVKHEVEKQQLEAEVQRLNGELSESNEKIAQLKYDYDDMNNQDLNLLDSFQRQVDDLEAKLSDATRQDDSALLDSYQAEVDELKSQLKRQIPSKLQTQLPVIIISEDEATPTIQELQDEIAELQNTLQKALRLTSDDTKLKLSKLREENSADLELNEMRNDLETAKANELDAERRLATAKEQLEQCEQGQETIAAMQAIIPTISQSLYEIFNLDSNFAPAATPEELRDQVRAMFKPENRCTIMRLFQAIAVAQFTDADKGVTMQMCDETPLVPGHIYMLSSCQMTSAQPFACIEHASRWPKLFFTYTETPNLQMQFVYWSGVPHNGKGNEHLIAQNKRPDGETAIDVRQASGTPITNALGDDKESGNQEAVVLEAMKLLKVMHTAYTAPATNPAGGSLFSANKDVFFSVVDLTERAQEVFGGTVSAMEIAAIQRSEVALPLAPRTMQFVPVVRPKVGDKKNVIDDSINFEFYLTSADTQDWGIFSSGFGTFDEPNRKKWIGTSEGTSQIAVLAPPSDVYVKAAPATYSKKVRGKSKSGFPNPSYATCPFVIFAVVSAQGNSTNQYSNYLS